MNRKQKILTYIALASILLTAWVAPWEFTGSSGHSLVTTKNVTAPIFSPPPPESYRRIRLRSEMLFMEWAAIGIIYAGLFFCFKTDSKGA